MHRIRDHYHFADIILPDWLHCLVSEVGAIIYIDSSNILMMSIFIVCNGLNSLTELSLFGAFLNSISEFNPLNVQKSYI